MRSFSLLPAAIIDAWTAVLADSTGGISKTVANRSHSRAAPGSTPEVNGVRSPHLHTQINPGPTFQNLNRTAGGTEGTQTLHECTN